MLNQSRDILGTGVSMIGMAVSLVSKALQFLQMLKSTYIMYSRDMKKKLHIDRFRNCKYINIKPSCIYTT